MLARKLLQRCQSLTRGAAGFVYQPQTADPNLGKNHLHLCFDKFILWFFLAETVDRQARIMGLFSLKSKHLIPYQIVFLLKLFLILTVVLNRWDDKAQYVPVYQQCDGYSHGGRLKYRFVVTKVVCLLVGTLINKKDNMTLRAARCVLYKVEFQHLAMCKKGYIINHVLAGTC